MARRFDVQGYVDDRLGVRLRSSGENGEELVCDCPWCGGSQKLYVNLRSGLWVCYRCGEAGGITRLVSVVDGVSMREAKEYVATGGGHATASTVDDLRAKASPAVTAPAGPAPTGLPEEFVPCWDRATRTWSLPWYVTHKRGIKARTAAAYGLGYCLEGRYRGRLILPAHVYGEVATYQGRAMEPDQEPRYLGPKGSGKGATVYGLDEAVGTDHVVVVEGPTDVLGMAQKGYAAVALMGKAESPAQAVLLRRAGFSRATILLDSDAPGEDTLRVAALLGEILDARVARLPPPPAGLKKYDPDNAPVEVVDAALQAARPPKLTDRLRTS